DTDYRAIRAYVQSFLSRIQSQLGVNSGQTYDTWVKRYQSMLSFDFEAAVQLKQWETLESLVEAAKPVADEHLYSVYADAVLSSEASVEQKTRVFEQIVDAFQTSNNQLDSSSYHKKLPRYFRCLFELSMASTNNPSALSPANTAMAEMVLDRVYMFARDTHLSPNKNKLPTYPTDELEW
ncbi:hypothetical protein Egran_02544, partial [Elaphomyces granulatus]